MVPGYFFQKNRHVTNFTTFLFFLFWPGLCDPIEFTLFGGGIPYNNSGYKITRIFPYNYFIFLLHPPALNIWSVFLPVALPYPLLFNHLHHNLLLPLPPFYSSPPYLGLPVPINVETSLPQAFKRTAHRCSEVVGLKYTARPCSASS